MKGKKKAFLLSFLSLLMCVSMFIGTTFAWFTDTASTAVNKIQAGNLDIELQYQKSDGTWDNAEGKTLDFKKAAGHEDETILWEPGCTYELPAIRIFNKGDLALKYKIAITGINGNAKLNEVIDWTIGGEALVSEYSGTMIPGENENVTSPMVIKGHMREEAGNEYQGLYIDGIGITVVATQLNSENDSFGNDYDENATYPITVLPEIKNASMTKNEANDYIYTNSDKTVKATVPSGAILTNSETEPTVSIKPTTVDNMASTAIKSDGKDAIAYDIKVDNLAEDNTEKVSVELFVGKNLVGVTVYHNSEAMNVDDYSYNAQTGYVTIRTANFSTFSVAFKPPVASVNGVAYYTLESAIESAEADQEVVLLKDITLTQTLLLTKTVTLNLGGKTIFGNNSTNIYLRNTGNVTVKNGKVDVSGEAFRVNGMDNNTDGALSLTIESDVTVKSSDDCCVYIYGRAVLNTAGNLYSGSEEYSAIQTHGNHATTVVNVTGGNVKNEKYIAIYFANGKELNISGGTVTGTTAVAVKGGKVTISNGAYLHGVGEKNDSTEAENSGSNDTGDAFYIEDNYSPAVEATITGGKFVSDKANAVDILFKQEQKGSKIIITGGAFSSDPSEYCAEGYGAIETEGMFNVIAGTFAKTVEELASKVNTATTKVYVTNDLTFDSSVSIPAGITIDALNHKFTINNLNAFSGKGFTVENAVFEKGTTWGMATGSCSYENCTFNNVSPYICPSTDLPISVKNCTFNDTMLQICWSEGSEKDPTKQTTTITGNTFNYTATDSKNHVIALNAGSNINYSKVEVSNNTFNNNGVAAYSALYISDPVHSKGGISVNYFDNVENNASIGYRDSNGYYKKVVENNVVYAIYENEEKYLVKVTADYEGESFEIPDGVVAIGDSAFSSSTVKKVVVPASVTDLGRGFDSSVVEEVSLPEGLTTISSRAFRKTPNLKSLTIPSTVTTIVENAFQQAGIETIVIPSSVTSIEHDAFLHCANLTTVTIEGSPTIANYAFRACSSLTTVNLKGADVKFGEGIAMVFSVEENNNNNSQITVYVVNETVQARVDAIKGSGTPYNIVLRKQTA